MRYCISRIVWECRAVTDVTAVAAERANPAAGGNFAPRR